MTTPERKPALLDKKTSAQTEAIQVSGDLKIKLLEGRGNENLHHIIMKAKTYQDCPNTSNEYEKHKISRHSS